MIQTAYLPNYRRITMFSNEVIFTLKEYMEQKGFGVIDSIVVQRRKGRKFLLPDHIRALIYALLTNQRKWSDVEPHLPEIDRLFFYYDIDRIMITPAEYFERGVRALHCGNIGIKKQMQTIHENLEIFEDIEKAYGSMDAFVTSAPSEKIVNMLSSNGSRYKLKMIGPALAEEYLRNVGIDEAKADTHLRRFFGAYRMGMSSDEMASEDEVSRIVARISQETGLDRFEIDYLIWAYCADGKAQICTKTPNCNNCVIRQYCRQLG